MNNTTNGKTPEEIKNGLECCISPLPQCAVCPLFDEDVCRDKLVENALAYIQQLERERDAAVKDIVEIARSPYEVIYCDFCKYGDDETECAKRDCRGYRKDFEWRGVQEEEQ